MRRKKYVIYSVILVFLIIAAVLVFYLNQKSNRENPIKNFEDCATAGNTIVIIKDSPRQCSANGENFFETNNRIYCTNEQRNLDCAQSHSPVCGYIPSECTISQCDIQKQTFSNSCFACSNEKTAYYIEGEC